VLYSPATATTPMSALPQNLKARAQAVAAVAAANASAVDRDSRFPAESFAEAREQRLLGITVPEALGGEDHRRRRARTSASCSAWVVGVNYLG
jgi:acyl-CoA dehydrogenase